MSDQLTRRGDASPVDHTGTAGRHPQAVHRQRGIGGGTERVDQQLGLQGRVTVEARPDEGRDVLTRHCIAAMATVAYADVFDFVLTPKEVHRDLIEAPTTFDATQRAVDALVAEGRLIRVADHLALPEREGLSSVRRLRSRRQHELWPTARRMGEIVGNLPFVRLVALTGSLAAGNPDARADLDYLIVTEPGRLWLVRAMAIGVVRVARRFGAQICPNYLLTTRALALDHHDLFTAHELLQAVPLVGASTYQELRRQNSWARRWLPNRWGLVASVGMGSRAPSPLKLFGEAALSGPIGNGLERWESGRKRSRLAARPSGGRFTADVCEGHESATRRRVLDAFAERRGRLGLPPLDSPVVISEADPSSLARAAIPRQGRSTSPASPAPNRVVG